MDYRISARTEDFRRRISAFVEAFIMPLEAEPTSYDAHENIRADLLEDLRSKARSEGLWCLQLKPENGGQGLDRVAMAVCYEAMNRSIFGPVVFNSAAPDDGNMMLLEAVATPEQRARWLEPIAAGRVRSSFVMTEPMPGGGSDPSAIRTTAQRNGNAYVVHGRKWFITGAGGGAAFHPDRTHLRRSSARAVRTSL